MIYVFKHPVILTFQIIEIINDISPIRDLDKSLPLEFFKKTVYPIAVKQYQVINLTISKSDLKRSDEPLIISLVIRAIQSEDITVPEVCQYILQCQQVQQVSMPFARANTFHNHLFNRC